MDTSKFIDYDQWNQFCKRASIFYDGIDSDILSQKFSVQGRDYDISVHFFPYSEFIQMVSDPLEDNLQQNKSYVKLIKDYKNSNFKHSECRQRGFLGGEYVYKVPPQRNVPCGVVTTLPSYIVY